MTVVLETQRLVQEQPITVSWPAWRPDRSTHIDIYAGLAGTTLRYHGGVTDLSVTSHVVPGLYLRAGSTPFDVEVVFNGEFRPTGGVGGQRSPDLTMRYEHAFSFQVQYY